MQKSNNRFSKPRSSDKKPAFKSGSKSSSSNRSGKPERDSKNKFSRDKFSDKPYKKKEFDGEKRSFRDKDKPKSFERGGDKPFRKKQDGEKSFDRPFKKRDGDEKRSFRDKDKKFDKPYKKREGDEKPFRKKFSDDKDKKFDRPYKKHDGDEKKSFRDKDKPYKSFDRDKKSDKPYKKRDDDSGEKSEYGEKKKHHHSDKKHHDRGYKKTHKKHHKKHSDSETVHVSKHEDGSMRLNKYLANAGVSSRREADELIKAGAVTVNGKVVTEMGFRVMPTDKINYGGETLRNEKKVYLILNKPKDYLTTTDDPRDRRTVMELIKDAGRERVYPVGRLDRNTTGLLLFTNDGDLATKLMHPKHGIKKVYHVLLNKNMKPDDYAQLHEGVELEDGFIKPDDASFITDNKKEIGIEIHSGKNRIVRRIFEHLGYEVIKLDRVVFAGLTKKDLPRGKWRFLNTKEIGYLKMLG